MTVQRFTKDNVTVLIWEMTESEAELFDFLQLEADESAMYHSLKSAKRKLEYLGLRAALKTMFGKKVPLAYFPDGKPFLTDNSAQINVSHSGKWLALIAHPDAPVGIDIECPTDKIERLAHRFLGDDELKTLSGREKLQIAWSAKEALYKIIGKQAVDFAGQLRLLPFDIFGKNGEFKAEHIPSKTIYTGNYLLTDDYTLVYVKNSFTKKPMKTILEIIKKNAEVHRKMLAILLDPDICHDGRIDTIIARLTDNPPDFIFIGGSHATTHIDLLINKLKSAIDIPLVLFPGNVSQFSPRADALLNISLLSGRNAEFLIGQHVISAMAIKQSGIEVIPTAYLLIEGGKTSSVEYMSNTRPIPRDKKEIALSTAGAGELLGMQLVYLEAGSGALLPVPPDMIRYVKEHITVPLIVGGGIRTTAQLQEAYNAGADLVVAGNVFETEPEKIKTFVNSGRGFSPQNVTPQ